MAPGTGRKPKGDAQSLKRKRDVDGHEKPQKTVEESVSQNQLEAGGCNELLSYPIVPITLAADISLEPQDLKNISNRGTGFS
jgi:hypothetical protein